MAFLRLFKNEFHILAENKTNDIPVFSAINNKLLSIARENFDTNTKLNNIVNKTFAILEKHIRTHSFRATVITELIKSTPIEDVAEFLGHVSISSTLE